MKSSFSWCPQHENFEELAALATAGELSPLELERLGQHLAECPPCREAYEGFAVVASNDLGVVVAAGDPMEEVNLGDADETEAQEHLRQLRSRLKDDTSTPQPSAIIQGRDVGNNDGHARPWLSRRVAYGLAATILLTATVGSGIALWRTKNEAAVERARSRELQAVVDSLKQARRSDRADSNSAVLQSLQESQKARDTLAKSLAASETRNRELLGREKASEQKLQSAIATAEDLRRQLAANDGERERLAKLQQESDAKLREALVELYQARQGVQTVAKSEPLEDATLEATSQPSAEGRPALASPSEVEARNLFGARDLHIVDVYDVTGEGKTKRTYGRVYYVEKRLLMFYAFDLEKKSRDRAPVSFQAWGYREANVGKPINLGLFTIDDNTTGRWVLTVNRADVLSHIDAVFVTVEPPGGNSIPRGKRVLYANLIGPPNHP
jgi:hypothetical protein